LLVALRPATDGDEPFLYRVYGSTRGEELAVTGWDDAAMEAFLRMQYEAQRRAYRAAYPKASFDVVVVDERDAGRLYVDRAGTGSLRVIDIALLPEHRGAGVGTHLLESLLREGEAGGHPVRLSVERSNRRAGELYARLGFEVVRDGEVYLELECRPGSRP
jgi:ribosomal protein S18 acetylase RimI-like enzyme